MRHPLVRRSAADGGGGGARPLASAKRFLAFVERKFVAATAAKRQQRTTPIAAKVTADAPLMRYAGGDAYLLELRVGTPRKRDGWERAQIRFERPPHSEKNSSREKTE